MTTATWVARTLAFVAAGGYLDKVSEVYPISDAVERPLPPAVKKAIIDAMAGTDDAELVRTVLKLTRFPFNDPYVAFLRRSPSEVLNSPETTKRLARRLREMGSAQVLMGAEAPREANRQMGPMFHQWLQSKYLFVNSVLSFRADSRSPIFLNVSDNELLAFANQQGCALNIRPDFVAKSNGRFVVGEAKFIGDFGGKQDDSFAEAMTLASARATGAITVAILDGVCWLPKGNNQMQRILRNFPGYALSALLLDDFLASV